MLWQHRPRTARYVSLFVLLLTLAFTACASAFDGSSGAPQSNQPTALAVSPTSTATSAVAVAPSPAATATFPPAPTAPSVAPEPTLVARVYPTPVPPPTAIPAPTATPRPDPTPRPAPPPPHPTPPPPQSIHLTLTFCGASATDHVSGSVCVHTVPGAGLTIVVRYCTGHIAVSRSLKGMSQADSGGNHTWSWTPDTKCKGQATATVVASLHGQQTAQSVNFIVR